MKRVYRIALVEWETPFGEKVTSPSPQLRVGYFWWHTLTHCESIRQAMTYISNHRKRPVETIKKVVGHNIY